MKSTRRPWSGQRLVVGACAWGLFAILALAGWILFNVPWHHQPRWTRTFHGLRALPVERSERIKWDLNRDRLSVVESLLDGQPQYGSIRLRLDWPGAVTAVLIRIRAVTRFDLARLIAYPVPAYLPNHDIDRIVNLREVRGYVGHYPDGSLSVEYHFPTPASQLELAFPPEAELDWIRADIHYVLEDPWTGMLNHLPSLTKWGYVGLVLWWFVRWGPAVWPRSWLQRPRLNHAMVRYVLIGLVAVQGIVLVLFLPPFQGPDENVHWKAALGHFRRGAVEETAAYQLPEMLAAEYPRWYCFIPFQGQLFRKDARLERGQPNPVHVDYSSPFTYPVVGMLAWWYPRVETTAEAITFYYLCRLFPWLLGMALLVWANRCGWLNYSALVFISFPLVTQQLLVISSDTITNWGTVAAACVFASAWRQPTRAKVMLLWLICVAVVMAKPPIYAGILVLPLCHVPWARLPYKRAWVPLLGLFVVLGAIGAVRLGWRILEKAPDSEQSARMAAQLAYVLTPEGFDRFIWSCRWLIFRDERFLDDWFQPLGWLDTQLSEWHRLLIWSGFWLALLLDLIERRRELYAAWCTQRMEWLCLLGIAVWYFLTQMLAICGLMYIVHTPLKQYGLTGVQVRYLFPGILMGLFLPFATRIKMPTPARAVTSWLAWPALIFIGLGLILRTCALAIDLLVRYWH